MGGRSWTEEEDCILRENPEMYARDLAGKLGRTRCSVERRRERIGATYTGTAKSTWTEEDLQILRENPNTPLRNLADKLGRSISSVSVQKSRVARGRNTGTEEDFDTRPSGWYEETIGMLLLEFPDAFETWKHYHRYTVVEHVEEARSWVTLRCFRNADA